MEGVCVCVCVCMCMCVCVCARVCATGGRGPPTIVESTYGIAEHEKREDREARFLGWVDKIVKGSAAPARFP